MSEEIIDYNELNNQQNEEENNENFDQNNDQNNQEQQDQNQNEEQNGDQQNDQQQNNNSQGNQNSKDQERSQQENDQEGEYDQEQNDQNEEDQQIETSEVDQRSVYVQNVDYGSTKDDIIQHFNDVGEIARITILKDKNYGQPIGGCYIEFQNADSVELAKGLTDSMLRGRQIKVVSKRTNVHNFGGSRGRGRGRGGMRRPTMGFPMYMRGNYMMSYRGGRGGRGRGGYRPF